MFNNREEYVETLRTFSHDLKEIYNRATVLGLGISGFLQDYKVEKVDESFFNQDSGGGFVNDSAVKVSLQAALAGNMGNLGKNYSDVYYDQVQEESNLSALVVTTSTDVQIGLIIFKGDDLEISFDENDILKVYGIVVRMDNNFALVDKGGHYGRTLNLYANVPTFIYAPSEGSIHGIADYSEVLRLKNDDSDEDDFGNKPEPVVQEKKEAKGVESIYPSNSIFVVFNSADLDRFIPRQEGNIIDWEFYNTFKKMGYSYEQKVNQDLIYHNIKFKDEAYNALKESFKKPLVNYKYLNRENCSLTTFYAVNQNVDVLRLDITSDRSTRSMKVTDSFTSSSDYSNVGLVFTVINDCAFSYDIEISAADFLAGIGYQNPTKRMVFIQADNVEELEARKYMLEQSYTIKKLQDEVYEYYLPNEPWEFRAFLIGPDFKFVDEVVKL